MPKDQSITPQAAAIPIRDDGMICLITSSSGRRWGIPKGMIDPGMSAEETALQEAWEEAGVRGDLDADPVGAYQYEKWGLRLEVTVYVLRVNEIDDEWLEENVRERCWLPPREAIKRIDREEIKGIVRDVLEH